ncbi:hypothetical protein LJR130_004380 [Variovorax sp. LjRoot130]|uniref:hypothetical protein n=1 Tax=Variovorax sp. LjRoot130 TaxID=3342261 RepID=UPI003ECD12FB
MDSPVVVRKRYQRFFAWTFVFATMLALGMFWVELAFPPPPVPPAVPAGTVNPSAFDLHDLQLLVVVAALVAALASFAGLVIATPLAWLEIRRERTRAAIESALKRQDRIDRLAAARVANWPGGRASRTVGHLHDLHGHLSGR